MTNVNSPCTGEAGHPLQILMLENEQLKKRLDALEEMIRQQSEAVGIKEMLEDLSPLRSHDDKKDELVIVMLKRNGIEGPWDDLWNEDGELSRRLRTLRMTADSEVPSAFRSFTMDFVKQLREMIRKEETLLYPRAEEALSLSDWQCIYSDFPKFGYAWLKDVPVWAHAAKEENPLYVTCQDGSQNDAAEIHLPSGTLTLKQLEGILRTLPMELTFIDANEVNRYFSENTELVPRPLGSLGEEVYDCHPQRVREIVRSVIEKLKSGEQDMISFPAEKRGRKVMIQYLAVRDRDGGYLGLLETVQEVEQPRIR